MGKKKAKPLKVRCSFEPDRMAAHYLKEAYEQLVPTATCTIVKNDVDESSKCTHQSSSKASAT
jgi:hypothetical protein